MTAYIPNVEEKNITLRNQQVTKTKIVKRKEKNSSL